MNVQFGVLASAAMIVFAGVQAAPAASIGLTPRGVPPAHAAPPAAPALGGQASPARNDPAPAPEVSQDAPARSRMHECGHQWSAMKKAGTVGAMTWKEFSATCLVVSK